MLNTNAGLKCAIIWYLMNAVCSHIIHSMGCYIKLNIVVDFYFLTYVIAWFLWCDDDKLDHFSDCHRGLTLERLNNRRLINSKPSIKPSFRKQNWRLLFFFVKLSKEHSDFKWIMTKFQTKFILISKTRIKKIIEEFIHLMPKGWAMSTFQGLCPRLASLFVKLRESGKKKKWNRNSTKQNKRQQSVGACIFNWLLLPHANN